MSAFRKELESLINRYSKENGSNTPDFILAEYLDNCLESFDSALQKREKWCSLNVKGTINGSKCISKED
jgi:hypothetical protein